MARQKEQKERHGKTNTQETSSEALQTSARQGATQSSQQTGIASREGSFPSLLGGSPFTFMRRFSEEMDRLYPSPGSRGSVLSPIRVNISSIAPALPNT